MTGCESANAYNTFYLKWHVGKCLRASDLAAISPLWTVHPQQGSDYCFKLSSRVLWIFRMVSVRSRIFRYIINICSLLLYISPEFRVQMLYAEPYALFWNNVLYILHYSINLWDVSSTWLHTAVLSVPNSRIVF